MSNTQYIDCALLQITIYCVTSIPRTQRDKSGERGQQAGSRLSYIHFHLGNLGL